MYARLLARTEMALRNVDLGHHPALSLKPDDLMFVALLTTWVLIVALVAYLLLGVIGAGVVMAAASLFAAGMIAVQSRAIRRHGSRTIQSRG
jgi:hypothetical protein